MKNLILIFLLAPTIYVNYLVYKSIVIQGDLLVDYNTQQYRESTTASFNTLNLDFPSIGVTTLPIKHLVSKYYFLSGDYQKALKLIEEGNKENPFLKSGSMFKAEIYDHLGVVDSAYYYSKDAFDKMPGTPRHFLFHAKNLVKLDLLDELLTSYDKVKKFKNFQFHSTFIVSLKEILKEKKIDSLDELVLNIRDRFPDDEKIRVASDHFLYGIENIKKSIEFSELATTYFNQGQFNEAIFNFKKASEYNPSEYVNFENIAYVYIQMKKYSESLPYLYEVIEKKHRNIKGKSEFLLGLSLLNLDSLEKSCAYFNQARKLNFPESYRFITENCN